MLTFLHRHPRWYLYVLLFGILCGMLFLPGVAATGARNGLLLWFETLLPVLLPFLILSGLILRLDMTRPLNRLLSPIICRLFPVSEQACYPMLLGLLYGMPLGAKTTATLYTKGQISRTDASFLLAFSNNTSLMFLIGYVIENKLQQPARTLSFLGALYLSALLSALLFPEPKPRHTYTTVSVHPRQNASEHSTFQAAALPVTSVPKAIDESIVDALQTITRVGGYIILFSMLSGFLQELSFLPYTLRAATSGLLEITGGIQALSKAPLPVTQKTALILAITSFGGLSGLMQTQSVTQNSGLSIKHYLFQKSIQAVLTYALTALLLRIWF